MRAALQHIPITVACFALAALAAGCGASSPSTAATTGTNTNVVVTVSAFHGLPTKAQPKLPTLKLWLGAEEMNAEIAADDYSRMTGMMFRTNMAENEGMLFVFPLPHKTSFWMMNTKLPLSAAYIDPEGVVLEIHKLQPLNTNSVEAATDRVQFVLETPQGWFERHNVNTGAVVRTELGSLPQVFLKQRPR